MIESHHATREELQGVRVLFLNWRDTKHPQAGGSETYVAEVVRRLTRSGTQVTLFTSRPKGAASLDIADGVRVVRHGGQFSTYVHAALFLMRAGHLFDAIVDVQNGIPFFSPLFTRGRVPVVGLIHHVHQDQFAQHFAWPIYHLGRALEGPVSRWVYRGRPIAVVSPSTRYEVRHRLRLDGSLHVVPNGIAAIAQPPGSRTVEPTVVVVSRLSAHKRIDLVLKAAAELHTQWPTLHIAIAGDGPERSRLATLARQLGLEKMVTFHGWVSEAQKQRLMVEAWITVCASEYEGWGLNILEANALGIPAVARNVSGLRDSIRDGITGWLLEDDVTLSAGIDRALRAVSAAAQAREWADRCKKWAGYFSWDRTADLFAGIITAELRRQRATLPHSERRHRNDAGVILELCGNDQELVHFLSTATRATDRWTVAAGHAWIHLQGCDEDDAMTVIRRSPVTDVVSVRTAFQEDLLLGMHASNLDRRPAFSQKTI